MAITKKIISNTIYLLAHWLAITLFSLLFWAAVGKLLMPDDVGVISTSINFVVLISGLGALGLPGAAWKLTPDYVARGQLGKVKSLVIFSLKLILFSNLLIAVFLLLLSSYVMEVLKIDFLTLLIIVVSLFTFSLHSYMLSVVYGFQKMRRLFWIDSFAHLSKVILAAILVMAGWGYRGPLVGFILCFFLGTLLLTPHMSLDVKSLPLDRKTVLQDYALPALVATLAWLVFMNGQYVLLTYMEDPQTTGYFTMALLLTSPVAIVPNILMRALLPIISQLSAKSDMKRRQAYLIELVFRYAWFFALPLIAFLLLFSPQVIVIFAKHEFLPAVALFPPLAFASLIMGSGRIYTANLYAIGQTRVCRDINIITCLAFFLIAPIFIHLMSAQGLALAYGMVASLLTLVSFFYIRRHLPLVSPLSYLGKLVVATLCMLIFIFLMARYVTWMWLRLLIVCIGGFVYLATLLPLGFYRKEDVRGLEFISQRLPAGKFLLHVTQIVKRYAS
jgi:O-antigen/teichoic acid export membrane protein